MSAEEGLCEESVGNSCTGREGKREDVGGGSKLQLM